MPAGWPPCRNRWRRGFARRWRRPGFHPLRPAGASSSNGARGAGAIFPACCASPPRRRPLHTLIRLFSLGAPARLASAREALAPIPLEEWREAGLLAVDEDRVEALVGLEVFEGLLLALDRPDLLDGGAEPDHVSGVTNSTVSLAAFMERRAFDDILDLGTGGGVLAFLAARAGRRVLATDVNPRAIQFARFNARLNGAANVEFAVGGAFEPARGRRFDLILANPPCVIGPAARYAFSDSGMEMDSLCRQIVAGAPDYLKAGGLFQATAQWPNFGRAEWKERVSEWLRGGPCDALALHLLEPMRRAMPSSGGRYRAGRRRQPGADVPGLRRLFRGPQCHVYFGRADRHAAARRPRGELGASGGPRRAPGHAFRRRGVGILRGGRRPGADGRRSAGGQAAGGPVAHGDRIARLGRARVEESYQLRQGAGFEFQAGVDWRIANLVRRLDGSRTLREGIAELAAAARTPFDAVAPPASRLSAR